MPPDFKAYTFSEWEQWFRGVQIDRPIEFIQIHHTWKPRKSDYRGESTIVGMWRYHTQTLGWDDIAQHFTVAPGGAIWDGRDLNKMPAGIKGHNEKSLMFEIIGNFDIGEEQLVGEQLFSILGAVNVIMDKYGLTEESIIFHREYSAKTCPGSGLSQQWFLQQVRDWRTNNWKVGGDYPFNDVPADSYAREAIWDLYKKGLISGRGDGKFGYGEPMRREEAASLIARTMEYLQK